MDFLESLLLGPVWTDNDKKAGSKTAVLILLSLGVIAAVFGSLFSQRLDQYFRVLRLRPLALFVFLISLSAMVLNVFYGRFLFLRPFVLLMHLLKYGLFMHFEIVLFLRWLPANTTHILQDVLARLSSHIDIAIAKLAFMGGVASMICGIFAGVFWIILEAMLILLLILLLPIAGILLFRAISDLADFLLKKLYLALGERRAKSTNNADIFRKS